MQNISSRLFPGRIKIHPGIIGFVTIIVLLTVAAAGYFLLQKRNNTPSFYPAALTLSPEPSPVPSPLQPTHTPVATPSPKPQSVGRIKPFAWSAHQPLVWADFSGQVQADSPFNAEVWTKIDISSQYLPACSPSAPFTCEVKIGQFRVTALVNPALSWVRESAKTEALLEHEQLHFDLQEVYARKIRSAVAGYIGRTEQASGSTAEEAINAASQKLAYVMNPIVIPIQEEANRVQEQYDAETGHRLGDPVKQAEWKIKIQGWLGE